MKTTIEIQDELLRAAKGKAAEEGVPLRRIIETALRRFLGQAGPDQGRYRLRWRTEKGKLQPGVNLEDREALFDLMEGR